MALVLAFLILPPDLMDRSLPVTAIEGIGPKTAALLEAVGIVGAFDLLRVSPQRLHPEVKTLASLAEVTAWRNAAALLQVEGVTPQAAEALVHAGVETVERLARQGLENLLSLFTEAEAHGLIPDVPTPAQCADMMRDAAILQHTGYLRGTVQTADGTPIADAQVRLGTRRATTDARGRFDLLRLPLGTATPLLITHPDHASKTIERPTLLRDMGAVSVRVIRLEAATAEPMPARIQSEIDGDTLPPTAGLPVRTVWLEPTALREHDLLMVRAHEPGDDTVRLVSKLKAYVSGEIQVYAHKVPVAHLPNSIKNGDHFRVRDGALVPIAINSDGVRRYKIKRRLARSFDGAPKPTTVDAFIDQLKAQAAFLKQHGFFNATRRV